MAQAVGYYDNDVTYTDGPFVLVNAMGNGWRIEVELKRHTCPVLPDASIYRLLRSYKLQDHKSRDKTEIERSVDWLNNKVKDGSITEIDGWWLPVEQGKGNKNE